MKNEGFSLIEVMIAMAIFAIGIMAIMQMHLWAVKNNSTANFINIATMAATDTVENLRGQPTLVDGLYNKKNGPVDINYTITQDAVYPKLCKVEVSATLRKHTIRLNTYIKNNS